MCHIDPSKHISSLKKWCNEHDLNDIIEVLQENLMTVNDLRLPNIK